jgi:adenine-specific DNA methylase
MRNKFHLVVPEIIYLEKGFYFILNDLELNDFKEELSQLQAEILMMDAEQLDQTLSLANQYRGELPFRDHVRDFMIAAQCIGKVDLLITYKLNHFKLMQLTGVEILTPEAFFERFTPSSIDGEKIE